MLHIEASDVATAWQQAFIGVARSGSRHEAAILVTEINLAVPNDIAERQDIKDVIEGELKARNLHSCETVANTIFPARTWGRAVKRSNNRDMLYDTYRRMLPRLQKRNKENRKGIYFARMIGCTPSANQLEHIITTYNGGNHRRSALTALTFDISKDHNNQRRCGFPCLHQVMFSPKDECGLSITGVYTTQYTFDRAYGNYLGLARLGRFVAGQINKELTSVVCIANIAQLGNIPVREAYAVMEKLEALV